jgi:hypothetical protein
MLDDGCPTPNGAEDNVPWRAGAPFCAGYPSSEASKVMDNAVANHRSGLSRAMTLLSLKKCKFQSCRGVVHRVPMRWMYSQDLKAKKKAPMARSARAFSAGDMRKATGHEPACPVGSRQ